MCLGKNTPFSFTHTHFWQQMCRFLLTLTNSPTPAECPAIQFSSDAKGSSRRSPQVKEPQDCLPTPQRTFQIPVGRSRSPGYSQLLSGLATDQRFLRPILRFDNLPEWLTEPRKTVYLLMPIRYKGYFQRLQINNHMKRTIGQGLQSPVKRNIGQGLRGPEHRIFCPCGAGMSLPPAWRCTEAPWAPYSLDF